MFFFLKSILQARKRPDSAFGVNKCYDYATTGKNAKTTVKKKNQNEQSFVSQ